MADSGLIARGMTAGGTEVDAYATDCLARSVFDPELGRTRFWALTQVRGHGSPNLFNHLEVPMSDVDRKQTGEPVYVHRPITAEAYEFYVGFLVSGNPALLRQAERVR